MQAFKGQHFEGRSFGLDESVFFGCKLTDCDLFYAGGDFQWVDTTFENCRFHWRGAARNTLALAQVAGLLRVQGPVAVPSSAAARTN